MGRSPPGQHEGRAEFKKQVNVESTQRGPARECAKQRITAAARRHRCAAARKHRVFRCLPPGEQLDAAAHGPPLGLPRCWFGVTHNPAVALPGLAPPPTSGRLCSDTLAPSLRVTAARCSPTNPGSWPAAGQHSLRVCSVAAAEDSCRSPHSTMGPGSRPASCSWGAGRGGTAQNCHAAQQV